MTLNPRVGIAALLLVIALALAWYAKGRTVLFALYDTGDPRKEPVWSILNPIRNRGPERTAAAFLAELRQGQADQAFRHLHVRSDAMAQARLKESQYPVQRWKLLDRRDSNEGVKLYYLVLRASSKEFDSPIWLTVQRTPIGWEVTEFESWY